MALQHFCSASFHIEHQERVARLGVESNDIVVRALKLGAQAFEQLVAVSDCAVGIVSEQALIDLLGSRLS